MGPHPHLMSLALKEIEKEMAANQVTEKVVTGKVMELKGIQLQKGLTESACINMTFPEYQKRMGYTVNTNDAPDNAMGTTDVKGKGKTKIKAQSELLLEAASKHLKENGLDNLDPEKFQRAVLEYVQDKTVEQLQQQYHKPAVKKEKTRQVPHAKDKPLPPTPLVFEIKSDDEDWDANLEVKQPGSHSQGSGPP